MTATQTRNMISQDLHPAYRSTPQSFSRRLIRSQAGQLLPSFVAKRNRSNLQTELNVRPDQLCPSKVNEESCWTVIADRELHTRLCDTVATLLKSSSDLLYKRERRVLSTYFELYLVGPSEFDARPTMVISCTSKDDYKRVKGLIKKYHILEDFPSVNLAATIGSPRSSRALEPLATRGENGATIVGPTGNGNHDRKEAAQSGDLVYIDVSDKYQRQLSLPRTIYISRDDTRLHKAVLGGLLKSENDGKVYGLTVAHAFDHYGAETTGHETPDAIGEVGGSPAAIAKINGKSSPPATSGSPDQGTNKYKIKSLVGTITKTSQKTADHNLDWALVDISDRFDLFQSPSAPRMVAPIPAEPTLIKLLRPEGEARGTLSSLPTYIRVHDGADFVPAWAITVDATIERGDCGSWVVDELTHNLYGHVAYGHPGDKVAYIVPAQEMFAQIKEVHDATLTLDFEPISESALKSQERERRRERRAERRRENSYRDRDRSPAKIDERPDPAPNPDSDSDTKRSRTRTRKRHSRILDRMRPSRKARRKRDQLGVVLKAAGTCFFLSVLLSVLIALHFGLALFAQYVSDNKLDELRDFLMDMVMQCFQLLIRETLATEDSESLQEYYKDQMTRLRDIRPPGERIARLKKAFDPDAKRKDTPTANTLSDLQKSPNPNVETNRVTPQAPTASKETPKPEKKWRRVWKNMREKKSSPPKPAGPPASQPQPQAPTTVTEHVTTRPQELIPEANMYYAETGNDDYYEGEFVPDEYVDQRRTAVRSRSRSRSYDRSRRRLEPRRRNSERSRSRSRSRDRDRRRSRRIRSPVESASVSSNVQKLIEYGTQGYEYVKEKKEQMDRERDRGKEEKNVRFDGKEKERDRERNRDPYAPNDYGYEKNRHEDPDERCGRPYTPLPPPVGTPVYEKPESSRDVIGRRETDGPVVVEVDSDDEDVKGGRGDGGAKEGEKGEKKGVKIWRSQTFEGDGVTFDEFAPDGVDDEDRDGLVEAALESPYGREEAALPRSREERRPRVGLGGSEVEEVEEVD